jgi:hypothetical protein
VPTADSITFDDYTDDVSVLSNETLYTDAEIQNEQSPASMFTLVHRNRLWTITDKNLAWYSKEFEGGVGIGFSSDQTIRFDPLGGRLIALGSLDANLIAFEQDQVWAVSGDGPDAAGNGPGFSEPVLISSTVGCRDPKSVCITPDGLIFKSSKGWYLLNRSLQTEYIGWEVRGFDDDICTNAIPIDGSNQIRCLSASGTTLVIDWFYKQWGTFTNHQGVDAMKFQGVYRYLRADGSVYVENPGSYLDDTVGFSMLTERAWFKFASLQGFQVARKGWLLGFFPGTNPLKVTIDYNFGQPLSAPKQQIIMLNPGTGDFGSTWGSDAFWGSSNTWGSGTSVINPDILQFKMYLKYHSCESIKITTEDQAPYSATKAYSLSSVDLEVGVRRGGFRVPQGQASVG